MSSVVAGAIATGGVRVMNDQFVRALRIPEYVIEARRRKGAAGAGAARAALPRRRDATVSPMFNPGASSAEAAAP
jgi:hypothetical protein